MSPARRKMPSRPALFASLSILLCAALWVSPSSAQVSFFADSTVFNSATITSLAATFESAPAGVVLGSYVENNVTIFAPGPINLFILTPGAPGSLNPPPTSHMITCQGPDTLDVAFSGVPPTAVSLEVTTNQFAAPVVTVFGLGNQLIGTYVLTQGPNTRGFLGILSDVQISRIHLAPTDGEIEDTGLDNIRTGEQRPPGVEFFDDFDGPLDPSWVWIRENPATWSLGSSMLNIQLDPGDLAAGTNNCRNLLVRDAPPGDYFIETSLTAHLLDLNNQASIVLYDDDDHYLAFGLINAGGLFIAGQQEPSGSFPPGIPSDSTVFLVIEKLDGQALLFFSSDSVSFGLYASVPLSFTPTRVGLVAFDGNPTPNGSTASYDFFVAESFSVPNFGRRLDINQVNLAVANSGSFGYDAQSGGAGLVYPRGTDETAMFAGGLWLGALVGPDTLVTVAHYGTEYGPGTMVGGAPDDPSRPEYQVYKVAGYSGSAADTAHVDRSGAELAADPTLDPLLHHSWSEYLAGAAPFGAPTRIWQLPNTTTPEPFDSVNVLGPAVEGDVMLWSVYNDADPNLHAVEGGQTFPLGVEVQQKTFAFNRPGPLANTVFLEFKVINKGFNSLSSVTPGLWSDPDIGGFTDDLAGYDSSRGTGYAYNGTNNDFIYNASPPALGIDLLRGPIIPGPDTLSAPLAFIKYVNGTDPTSYHETFNYLRGLLPDDSPIIDPISGLPTRYFHPGDPVTATGWLDDTPGDRRELLSLQPFDLAPGDTQSFLAALVIGQGNDRLSSITAMRANIDSVEKFFGAGGFSTPPPPPPPRDTVFAQRADFGTGSLPSGVAAGFLIGGGAGTLDLAVTNAGSNSVSIFSGNGDGTFAAPQDSATGLEPSAVALGDVNGDGFTDVVVANKSSSSLTVLYSPPGGFRPSSLASDPGPTPHRADFGTGSLPSGVAVADLNGDGFDDVVVTSKGTDSLSVFHGTAGDLSPDRVDFGTGSGPIGVVIGKIDADTLLDVLVVNSGENTVSLFRGSSSDSSLAPQRADFGTGSAPVAVAVGDLNGDNLIDCAIANSGSNSISVFLGDGAAGLTGRQDFDAGLFPTAVAMGDVDGDQHIDIVTANRNSNSLSLFRGRGDGLIAQRADFGTGSAPTGVVIGDFNGDGHSDVATVNSAANSGSVFENTGVATVATLLEAQVEAGVVRVTWFASGGPGSRAHAYRRGPSTDWQGLGDLYADESGKLVLEDRDVTAGGRYGYRLGVEEGSREIYVGEVWVDVSSTLALALGRAPNPMTDGLLFAFTLPVPGKARLEMFDVRGRRVLARELGPFEAGSRILRVDEQQPLPSGVYVVRLSQGGRSVHGKVVLLR